MATTRRQFTKTIGTALGVALMHPTILLRPTVSREAILQSFCEDSWSKNIATPFTQGSLTYATNAREIIRCELINTIDDAKPIKRPDADKVFSSLWNHDLAMYRSDLPSIETLIAHHCGLCPVCLDRRIAATRHATDYYYDEDYDPNDHTTSDRTCEWCYDQKTNTRKEKVRAIGEVDGCYFQYARIAKIAKVPNVRWAAYRSGRNNEDANRVGLLQFVGDGFQGLAMGFDMSRLAIGAKRG